MCWTASAAVAALVLFGAAFPKGSVRAEGLKRIYIADGVLAQTVGGKVEGPFPEILYEGARRIGQDIEIVPISWKRGQKLAQEESGAGAAGVTRIPSREDLYVWIEDFMPLTLTFFVLKNSLYDPKSMKDLWGLNVAIQAGAVADHIVGGMENHGMRLTTIPEPQLIPKMMQRGRTDGWLIWDIIGMENFRREGMLGDVRRTFDHVVGPVYLVTNDSVSDASVAEWRRVIAEMKADGTIQDVLVRYYGDLAKH